MPRLQYSDDIEEIMARIPGWIVRWGIVVIFILFMILLGISVFFKYPEVITSPIVLTTTNPPTDLIARSTGKIECLLIENHDEVKQNDVIAVLFNPADYRIVFELEDLLNSPTFSLETSNSLLTKDIEQLGELQSYYSALRTICKSYVHYMQTAAIPLQKEQIEQQISMMKTGLQTQNQQLAILCTDKRYEQENLERDSILYFAKAITEVEYKASQQRLLQKDLSIANQKNALVSTNNNILSLKKQLTDLTIQYENDIADFQMQFEEQKNQLLAQIKLWENNYVLSAPIAGKITLTKYWSKNQNITVGSRLATIVPEDSVSIIGRMTVPSSGLAKVKIGQQVNVKLSGFPYMEYGLLKGRLISLSTVPEVDDSGLEGYVAEVAFPEGLVSSYKNKFHFIQQMDGTAEIITKDTRLIERFVQPLRSLFENN